MASAARAGGERSTSTEGVMSATTSSQYPGSLIPAAAATTTRRWWPRRGGSPRHHAGAMSRRDEREAGDARRRRGGGRARGAAGDARRGDVAAGGGGARRRGGREARGPRGGGGRERGARGRERRPHRAPRAANARGRPARPRFGVSRRQLPGALVSSLLATTSSSSVTIDAVGAGRLTPPPRGGRGDGVGAEPSGDVATRLTALVLAAASEVVGASLASDVLRLPKERPAAPAARRAGGISPCHAPATLFHRLVALAAANASRATTPARASVDALDAAMAPGDVRAERVRDGGPGVDVTRVSPFGLARRRRYRDAADLADAVVEAMEPAALAELVADVRVDAGRDGVSGGEDEDDDATRREDVPGVASGTSRPPRDGVRDARGLGVLRVTTRRHLLAAAARGLLLCRACGACSRGTRPSRAQAGETPRRVRRRQVRRQRRARRSWRGRRRVAGVAGAPRGASTRRRAPPGRPPRKKNASTRRKNPSWTRASAPPMSPLGPLLSPPASLRRATAIGDARRLVASGWDARSCVDRHGSGAMHWAAAAGLDVCRYLADELGLDPRAAQPGDGRTALHWAARNGETATCEWLWRERGVDADATTRDGTPPFHWAVWQSRFETCEWLVETAGVNWRAKNAYGCNAAQWAAQSGDVAMLEWLRRLGLDFSALNANGHSAMHKAATRGHAAACRWLATRAGLGAEHMRADGDGNTPAVMARLEGFDELADELEETARRAAEEEERRGTTRGDDERRATSEEGRATSDERRATSDERLGK